MSLLLALAAFASAATAMIPVTGKVSAVPRAEAAKGSGGGAYAARDTQYAAALFDYKKLTNVVVHAVSLDGAVAEAPKVPPKLEIVEDRNGGMRFEPSFLAVPANTPIAFSNTLSKKVSFYAGRDSTARFTLELAPKETKTAILEKAAFYRIYCVFCVPGQAPFSSVLATGPFVTLPGAEGKYSLSLPPGRYKVTAWHERLPPETKDLEVQPGQRPVLDFELSVTGLPEVK